MKKLKIITVILVLFICCTTILPGCFGDNNNTNSPFLQTINLKTSYYPGERLSLANAKIRYFPSSNDTYTEEDLTSDMISGFSTHKIGTFTMTITYNNTTEHITYKVTAHEHQPNPEIISEPTALTAVDTALLNMQTFAEIKQTTTTTMFGISQQSYIVTNNLQQYSYTNNDNRSWIVQEDEEWHLYEISYDIFDDITNYTKYIVNTDETSLIPYQYTANTIIPNNSLTTVVFVQASQLNNILIITYNTPDMMDMYTDTVIIDNQLAYQVSYQIENNTKTITAIVVYEYFNETTNIIPNIPEQTWQNGGTFVKF